ncbi:hypothetical protein ISS04_02725 [Candidatus Woesearchaeota archaeon]|nr:hypothetical protein [Candidatus Woesearchaeota archaeon]
MALDDKLLDIAEKTAMFVGFSACAEVAQYGATYLLNNEISSSPLFSVLTGAGLALTYYFSKDPEYKGPLKKFEESSYNWMKEYYDNNQKE